MYEFFIIKIFISFFVPLLQTPNNSWVRPRPQTGTQREASKWSLFLWGMMSHYALMLFERKDSTGPVHVFLSSSPQELHRSHAPHTPEQRPALMWAAAQATELQTRPCKESGLHPWLRGMVVTQMDTFISWHCVLECVHFIACKTHSFLYWRCKAREVKCFPGAWRRLSTKRNVWGTGHAAPALNTISWVSSRPCFLY